MALLGPTGRHRESLIIGFQRTLLAVSRRTAQGCIGPRREVIFRRLPSCSLSRVERAERPVDTIYDLGFWARHRPALQSSRSIYPCGQFMRMGSRRSQFSAASRT
jgi:hypothetical protein